MIANIIIMILSAIGAVSTGVLVGGLLRYKADEKKRANRKKSCPVYGMERVRILHLQAVASNARWNG